MTLLEDLTVLLGRILISAAFLWAGVSALRHWKTAAEKMKAKNMPASVLPAGVLLRLVGGLSILLGYEARIGALLLIVYIIPTVLIMHPFWRLPDPEKATARAHFMKDTAILGGLLLLLVHGAGHFAMK